MGLFNRFLKRTERKSVPMSFFYNSGVMANIITKSDALDFYKSWVYACVSKRSMAIASLDFHLYQMKGNKVVELFEHPLLDLLYKVNPEMTKFNFLQLSIIYRDLLGASPWILEGGDKNGKNPTMIYLARPEYLKVNKNKDGKITGYTYQIGTYKKEYTADQVIMIKNYNPKDPDKGVGLIEAVRMTVENDDYILQTNNNLLKNGAVPGGFLETEVEVNDPAEIKRLEGQARSKYSGVDNAYKVQILQGGMKFKPNIIPPRDLEFIEGRKYNRDEVAAIFGVPKSLLTFDDVNLASAKTGEYQFAKFTLEPMATEIFEQLNEFLVPKFGEDLWLDYEPIAKEDEELSIRQNESAWNKWKTTNEIREGLGLAPIEGGNYIYMPFSTVPLIGGKELKSENVLKIGSGRVIENMLPLKKEMYYKKRILNRHYRIKKLSKGITDEVFKRLENNKVKVFRIVEDVKKKNLSDDQINVFYKNRMSQENVLEGRWIKEFKKLFKDQKKRFIEQLEKSKKGFAKEMGIDVEKEMQTTIEIIKPLMYETLITGVKQASELIDQPLVSDFDFLRDWLDNVSEKIGEQITDTTIKDFDKTLREGVENGESMKELTERVENVFEFASKSRADMIARTEVARGITEAHRQTYDYYGFYEVKWLLAPGSCEECEQLSQDHWNIDSIQGEIPVHPNCKCDFTPISNR